MSTEDTPLQFFILAKSINFMRRKDRQIAILGISIIIVLAVVGENYLKLRIEKRVNQTIVIPPSGSVVSIYIPAVDSRGNGVATTLVVEAKPGTGRVLVNVNQLLFWVDTQQSIQVAKKVAQDFTHANFSKLDLVYSIETNASLIEGPSAGAALAIATIIAVENKTLNRSVMITGTINEDGSIGQVGGIIPKAKAAKEVGATLFLVPEGQGTEVNYVPEEKCEKIGSFTFCTTTYKKVKENVAKSIGINVKEVSNIEDALKYFVAE